ncbi:hypothetical protein EGM85_11555 [Macrococcus caseolyticus]|nr:hypothetical protein [Macrococcus caseolyticus]RKO11196.1 hypothetical protein D6861_11555 [Macrococcus caseolyticus]
MGKDAIRYKNNLKNFTNTTWALFTGPASQKSAARAGFTTIATITLKELAEAGLNYPKDENRCIKLMVKRFAVAPCKALVFSYIRLDWKPTPT